MTSYKLFHMGGRHYRIEMRVSKEFVGWMDYSLITFDEIHVNHIEIIDKYRGYGFGRQLVEYMLEYYPHMKGAWRDLKAKGFWQKMGADFEKGRSFELVR